MIRAFVIGLAVAGPLEAAECRLALAIALDVSSSVDPVEDGLQRTGLARALLSPDVQAAMFSAPLPVAISVYEWSGRYHQSVLVDWSLMERPADAARLSAEIAGSERRYNSFPTAMGLALEFGAHHLQRGPDCLFQTIDIAGDGENNEAAGPSEVYRAPVFNDITVNGLVVNAADYEAEVSLISYYETEVLHGSAAFLEIAQGFEDYERAMTKKLVRELASPALSMGKFDAIQSRDF